MGVVDEALGRALNGARPRLEDPPPRVGNVDEAAAYYGRPRRERTRAISPNRAMADQLGVSIRTVQRWRKAERGEGGQTRHPKDVALRRRLVATANRRARAAWKARNDSILAGWSPIGRVRRAGLNMRLRAWLIVSQPPARVQTMPADAGGRPRYQWVPGNLLGSVLDSWQAGDREVAGLQLVDAFLIAYMLPGAEVTAIDWCQVVLV